MTVDIDMICSAVGVHYRGRVPSEDVFAFIRREREKAMTTTHRASYQLGHFHGAGRMPSSVPEPHWNTGENDD